MSMTMVCVRIMIVRMGHGLVMMPVAMPHARCNGYGVRVSMVLVVLMLVLVIHRFVCMQVDMVLGQVQPNADSHRHGRSTQLPRDPLAENQYG